LLSNGKFKPVYYDFYDDDVVYDYSYAGITEEQNDSQERILDQIRVKTFYNFRDLEKAQRNIVSKSKDGNRIDETAELPVLLEKALFLSAPLGTSGLANEYSPAWDVKISGVNIEGDVELEDETHTAVVQIPQINLEDDKYYIKPKEGVVLTEEGASLPRAGDLVDDGETVSVYSDSLADGSYFEVKGDSINIVLAEENVPFDRENFDIELFRISEGDDRDELIPLSFKKPVERIVDGILLDEEELVQRKSFDLDESYAEYYFDIEIDGEIGFDVEGTSKGSGRTYLSRVVEEDLAKCENK